MKPKNFQFAPSNDISNRVSAPEAQPARKGVVKGSRIQFTHTMTPEMFEQLNEVAGRYGQTRAGLINMILVRAFASDQYK